MQRAAASRVSGRHAPASRKPGSNMPMHDGAPEVRILVVAEEQPAAQGLDGGVGAGLGAALGHGIGAFEG